MTDWTWELRIRRLEQEWAPTNRAVRCALIPRAPAAGADGVKANRIPFEELPGLEVTLPVEFEKAKVVRFAVQAIDDDADEPAAGAELAAEGELVAEATPITNRTLRPFHVRNAKSDPVQEMKDRLREEMAGDPAKEEPSGEMLPWALDFLYRDPQPLDQAIREDSEPVWALVLAAASNLVFDATLARGAIVPDTITIAVSGVNTPVKILTDEDPANPRRRAEARPLEAAQFAHGFTFRLQLASDDARPFGDGEHRVRLERWAGAAPLGPAHEERVRRLPKLADADAQFAFHATDALLPTDLVGQQLHYRISLINCHERVVVTGAASVVRERLDPPAPVTEPRVTVSFSDAAPRVLLDIGLAAAVDDDLEWSGLALFAEDRGLDACGFYGDADDLALHAGLAALDLTGLLAPVVAKDAAGAIADDEQEKAYVPPPLLDEIVRGELEGRWTAAGLKLLAIHGLAGWKDLEAAPGFVPEAARVTEPGDTELSEHDGEQRVRLPFGAIEPDVMPPAAHGRRYHVVRFRARRRDGLLSARAGWVPPSASHRVLLATTSAEAACTHKVIVGGVSRPVFQIENIPSGQPAPVYLPIEQYGIEQEEGVSAPSLTVHIRHPRPSEQQAAGRIPVVGGFRLWMRDRVGSEDPLPFRAVATVQAVPALVASYRPLPLNGATPWRFGPPPHGEPLPAGGTAIADVAATRTKLAEIATRLTASTAFRVDPTAAAGISREGVPDVTKALERFDLFKDVPAPDDDARFPGVFTAVMEQLGLCLRVSLDIRLISKVLTLRDADLATAVSAALSQALPKGEGAGLSIWLAQDDEGHPYATCVIMPRMLIPDATVPTPLAKAILRAQWGEDVPLSGLRIRLVRQLPTEPVTRAYGSDRTCTYRWHGLDDRWRHELEWAVEVLDRYANVRQTANEAFVLDETRPPLAIPAERRTAVLVRRTEPVEEHVHVTHHLDSPLERLVFRWDDPAEHGSQAHNALNATRLGQQSVAYELRHDLFGRDSYEKFIAKNENWTKWWELPQMGTGWAESWKSSDDWAAAHTPQGRREVRLDLGPLPPYYLYTCSTWLVADGLAGPATSVTGRVDPLRLGMPENAKADVRRRQAEGPEAYQYTLKLSFPLARLKETHEDGRRQARPETRVWDLFTSTRDRPELERALVADLPDLELSYYFFIDLSDFGAPDLVPVAELHGAAGGVTSERGFFSVFHVNILSPWASADLQKHPNATVKLDVTLMTAAAVPVKQAPLWERLFAALEGHSSRPVQLYVELVRQSRSSGLKPFGRTTA